MKKALSYSPLESSYHYMLGTAYILSKRIGEAVRELEICVKQDPDNQKYQKMLYLAEDTASLLSGGIPGYEQYMEILRTSPSKNPEDEDPEIRDMREWIRDYDPECFDIEDVNERLKEIR